MWIRPLQAELSDRMLTLYAPNRFILDWVRDKYLIRINSLISEFCGSDAPVLRFDIGSRNHAAAPLVNKPVQGRVAAVSGPSWGQSTENKPEINHKSNVNVTYTFVNFVEGKSNQLARAAASHGRARRGRTA